MTDQVRSREARQGERTIEVSIRFWTNDIADTSGHIRPGHCWAQGMVSVPVNSSHGIESTESIPFNSIMSLSHVIGQALTNAGVRLHLGSDENLFTD